jgi:PAS domain-containing protein
MNTALCPSDPGILSGLLDTLPTPAVVVDDDGILVASNEPASALIGLEPDELTGRSICDVLHCSHLIPGSAGPGRMPICEDCSLRAAFTRTMGDGCGPARDVKVCRRRPHGHETLVLVVDSVTMFEGASIHSNTGCGRLSGVTPVTSTTADDGEAHLQAGTHWCITWGHEPPA